MATTSPQVNREKIRKDKIKKDLQRTDDKSELIVNVTYEYMASRAIENAYWESVKRKYEDIVEHFKVELPDEPPSSAEKEKIDHGLSKDYPHVKKEVTKQMVTTKLEAVIEWNINKLLTQEGVVVMVLTEGWFSIYYELCENIWGSSHTTEQLDSELESIDLRADSHDHSNFLTDERRPSTENKTSIKYYGKDADEISTLSDSKDDADNHTSVVHSISITSNCEYKKEFVG